MRGDPDHCHHCGAMLFKARLMLPRDKTGHLYFCNYAHEEVWRKRQQRLARSSTP